ncbi:primosomal protein N' [Ancylobacter novellus DSM 506]|uniref:Replication restart protein PriA n=1 Tax=Ancylobacter novellus (strain ATCC 8093 / DSM 506 / JCM 20403 / CCM 1077 / IAM 12100 / NBRC 12443 / NCIMB 10456) TaxID=639283 RepID=D7A8P8_ANCN5|nr:primosomal protein N' [Ancylobacter novellus]ADH90582.1 primosomal protein N' [Ancylobacter novellus DSM 506]
MSLFPPRESVVDVLLPVAVGSAYSYRVPEGMEVAPGDIVVVPLGPRMMLGCVWPPAENPKPVDPAKLKPIHRKYDVASLSPAMLAFIRWIADYTVTPPGMVLRLALRHDESAGISRERTGVRLTDQRPQRRTAARERVIEALADGFVRSKTDAAREAGVSPSVVDGLVDDGVLETVVLPPEPAAERPDPDHSAPELLPAQRDAADRLVEAVKARAFRPYLIDGVTGSGKTETYFEAVAETIRQGRQVLILMPEIALTQAFLDRFARRFGVKPAEWHSAVGTKRRGRVFKGVSSGEVSVVAGARSALFLPFRDLGLVIVDEEHDSAYKQEDGVHYHARDMAVVRARLEEAPVVLVSATPSIETEVNARRGRYSRLHLPERFAGTKVPRLEPIDLRKEGPPRGQWIAPRLAAEMERTIEAGGQALLFLNRRGYAPLTLCRACGHRIRCPSCSSWLVEHRFRRRLECHQCGYATPVPNECPNCHEPNSLIPCGPGVERLHEEVAKLMPNARLQVLSSDLAGGVERLRAELKAIEDGAVDVIVGTQLVAKGHNFPGLALVGVIDADVGLGHGDPRAAERTFQLLHQVAGRAGRHEKEGRAFLQTYMPEHPVMQALVAGDRDAFYDREIGVREEAHLPPFARFCALIVSGTDAHAAQAHARALAACSPLSNEVRVLGPAEAPLALVRGRHRYRLLARSDRGFDLSNYVRAWMAGAPRATGNLRVEIDIDPQSFL